MTRAIRAELRKLLQPAVLLITVVFFAALWDDARTTFAFAHMQTPTAAASDPGGAFSKNGVALGEVTRALSTWPGLLRFVTHQMATGKGWILLTLLLGLHVAAEWSSGTIGSTLLAGRNRRQLLVAKLASLWLAVIALVLADACALYAIRSTFVQSVGVPVPRVQNTDIDHMHLVNLAPDPGWSSWSTSLGLLAAGALIWLLFLLVGTALALLVRKPLTLLALSMGALALVVAVGEHTRVETILSPVGQLLRLQQTPYGVRDASMWFVPGKPGDLNMWPPAHLLDPYGLVLWALLIVAASAALLVLSARRRVAV